MSLRGPSAPRPPGPRATLPAARQLAPVVPVVVAVGLAFIMVALFVVLDYKFDQDPHRLVKIMLGVSVMCGILVWPRFGLVLLPVLTPFLGWLPKIPVPVLNPLNVLVVSIFLTWAIRRVLERRALFRPGRLGVALGAILGLAALSIVRGAALPTGYTYDAGAAAMMLFRSGMNFALYFIALSMVRGPRERRAVTWAVLLGLLAEALVTIKLGRSGRGARAIGSFGQANELGAFLAMFTVLGVALIPAVKRWGARLLLLGTVFAGAFATILTLSRGALVALVVGLFFVALRSSRALLVVLVLVLFSAPLWMPDFLRERIAGSTVEVQGSDEKGFDPSAQVRVDTWRAILSVVGDHPLDGVGFEGLSYVLPEAGEALGVEVVETAHNTYLRFLGEMGVFGLLLFVWLLWKCFQLGWAGARAAEDRFDRMLCVGLTGATVTMAVSCFFGDRFFSILITGNFWMLCALADDLLLERQGRTA